MNWRIRRWWCRDIFEVDKREIYGKLSSRYIGTWMTKNRSAKNLQPPAKRA